MPDSLQHSLPLVAPSAAVDTSAAVQPLVFLPADSAAQAFFGGEPAMLHKFVSVPDTFHREFPLPLDSVFLAQQRALWHPKLRELTWQHETEPYRPDGIAGDPVPYAFRNDDLVTSALLISLFLAVWITAASWRFLRDLVRDFFYYRNRPNLFTDRADTILRGRPFLVLLTSFMLGILFFDYTQHQLPNVFAQVSPYLLLGTATTLIGLGYGVKILLYRLVNTTFFPQECNRQWDNYLFTSILVTGALFLPLTLLLVYFDLPFRETLFAFVLLMGIVKTLIFYKAYRIFFSGTLGKMHIILYFCALEMVPFALLWALLNAAFQWLMAIS